MLLFLNQPTLPNCFMFWTKLQEKSPKKIRGTTTSMDGLCTLHNGLLFRHLGDQTTAVVEIVTQHPLCIEKYSDYKALGRFTLREGGRTIAAGIVTEVL
jgi:translation elongation factor EF-1alpha